MEVLVEQEEIDGLLIEELFIDGVSRLIVRPLVESPEDAIIERNLVGCCDIVSFMSIAYEAGRRGEDVHFYLKKKEE